MAENENPYQSPETIDAKPRPRMAWRWWLLFVALTFGPMQLGVYIGGTRKDPDWLRMVWIFGLNAIGLLVWSRLYRRFGLPKTESPATH